MKKLLVLLALAGLVAPALASTGFYKFESVGGRFRICHYNVMASDYAVTVKVSEQCPLTIDVAL
ncbi:hypothetical protein QTO01_12315 [Vibrio mytili]|uniref:Uncharacterized protein n=1 Tax=Vibrio mytili TaxID=50718 RepID=A0A0C3DK94_9VIBR|nr:hypothetical protein [Vibrio mytili]KIN11879.1 hypothetical protein SU60_05055 [Vibrio mytili]